MELINQTKTNFLVGKDEKGTNVFFRIGKVMDFKDAKLAKTLLRYEGINTSSSLKDGVVKVFKEADKEVSPVKEDAPVKTEFDLLKEEATDLGIQFAGNVSKAKLTELVEEAKTAPEGEAE